MEKILIVEDDEYISNVIAATISIAGYQYAVCMDGREAVKAILNGNYGLVLLDVMLPGMSGFEVMQKIRSSETPVIFLTSLHDISFKVKGLQLGAEDYIVKPFEAIELLARIEVVLRRFKKSKKILKFDNVTVDLEKHAATKDGLPVTLTPKEFDVLVLFLQNIDIALTRERLLASVWGYLFRGESRTVDIHVQQVRRKMGLKNSLITVPKLGYRLESNEELSI